jgi:hypothetical protein
MHRVLSNIVVSSCVVALMAPVATVSAASRVDGAASGVAAVDRAAAGDPAAPVTHLSLRESARKVAIELANQQPGTPVSTTARKAPRGTRAQMGGGGGGTSGMIVGIVSTVIGIGASVYMYKMMTKQNKDAQGQ